MARMAAPPVGILTGVASINGGEPVSAQLSVTQERLDISTNLPKPDPRWTLTDAAGHFHARSEDGELPTLIRRMEHIACGCSDCAGEGYDITHFHCRVCDEEITPGTIAGPHYETMPGVMSWELVVQDVVNGHTEVNAVFRSSYGEHFGVAIPTEVHVESGPTGPVGRTTLCGVSALGRRTVGTT